MRWLAAMTMALLALAGCGGGGGGGGGGSGATPAPQPDPNVATIQVGRGAYNVVNLPMVSVTVCAPGNAAQCYVVDNILLDTGSIGLRLVGATLSSVAPSLQLPVVSDTQGNGLYECIGFIDGSYAWGAVRRADVKIAGETASNIPVQVIGDTPSSGARPSQCTSTDSSQDLAAAANLGANGILGVRGYAQDCGSGCATAVDGTYYFTCSINSCTAAGAALASQVTNPVAAFATDNNGVLVQLPAVAAGGSAAVSGSLIFGIGTRANNALDQSVVHQFDSYYLTTAYKGTTFPAFVDSGSNALYFDDLTIRRCNNSSFFCPSGTLNLSADVGDYSGFTKTVLFNVSDATTPLSSGKFAFSDFAGLYSYASQTQGEQVFDWGLPFFFGRNVYFGMEGTQYENVVGF